MPHRSRRSIVVCALTLVLAPVAVAFGVHGLPSFDEIRNQKTADIVGVWVMTWGLVLLAAAGAVAVAWLAWFADDATRHLDDSTNPASLPDTNNRRSVA